MLVEKESTWTVERLRVTVSICETCVKLSPRLVPNWISFLEQDAIKHSRSPVESKGNDPFFVRMKIFYEIQLQNIPLMGCQVVIVDKPFLKIYRFAVFIYPTFYLLIQSISFIQHSLVYARRLFIYF